MARRDPNKAVSAAIEHADLAAQYLKVARDDPRCFRGFTKLARRRLQQAAEAVQELTPDND